MVGRTSRAQLWEGGFEWAGEAYQAIKVNLYSQEDPDE